MNFILIRRKMNARYLQVSEQLNETVVKFNNSEKIKSKLQIEVETLTADLDKVSRFSFLLIY
jgi:hypothetical protein